jgi:hypothetical protein
MQTSELRERSYGVHRGPATSVPIVTQLVTQPLTLTDALTESGSSPTRLAVTGPAPASSNAPATTPTPVK